MTVERRFSLIGHAHHTQLFAGDNDELQITHTGAHALVNNTVGSMLFTQTSGFSTQLLAADDLLETPTYLFERSIKVVRESAANVGLFAWGAAESGANAAVASGANLGELRFGGSYGTGDSDIAYHATIRGTATENWSSTARGTAVSFFTSDNGTSGIGGSERARFTPLGSLQVVGGFSASTGFIQAAGAEMGISSGEAFFQAYNRSTAAYIPWNAAGNPLTFYADGNAKVRINGGSSPLSLAGADATGDCWIGFYESNAFSTRKAYLGFGNSADDTFIIALEESNAAFRIETTGSTSLFRVQVNGTESIRVDANATAAQTRLMVFDVDNNAIERVSVGAADSGGAGFKVLRIPN